MSVNLSAFKDLIADAERTVLSGKAEDENTLENSEKITPIKSKFKVSKKFDYEAPAMSLTVIRIRTK